MNTTFIYLTLRGLFVTECHKTVRNIREYVGNPRDLLCVCVYYSIYYFDTDVKQNSKPSNTWCTLCTIFNLEWDKNFCPTSSAEERRCFILKVYIKLIFCRYTFLKIKDCEEELSYMQGHLIFTRANETFLLSVHDQKENGPVFTSTWLLPLFAASAVVSQSRNSWRMLCSKFHQKQQHQWRLLGMSSPSTI